MGTVLVTGASRGIGRGIAEALAAAGHRVAVHYNGNVAAAEECAAECARRFGAAAGGTASTLPGSAVFQADISSASDRERLVEEVFARFGSLDGLVNNAGIAPRRRDDIVYADEEIFDEVIRVNLNGPYFLTQLVARRWIDERAKSGRGAPGGATPARRIVFVTSVSAVMASTQRGEYCVSKAALAMSAQLYAARLAPEGVLVFEIRPGITKTDMTAGVVDKYDKLIADGLVPQGRWGFPSDTGAAVRSIMDGHLDFSPGSVIYTDGGLHIPQL